MTKKNYHVAIDVSPLKDGNSFRGVGYYTRNLVDSLNKLTKNNPLYSHWQIDLVQDPSVDLSKYDLIHYPYFDPFKLTLPKKSKTKRVVTVHDLIPREFKSHFPVGIKGELKWQIQKHRLLKSDIIITVSHYSKNVIADIIKFPRDRIFVTYEAADSSFKPLPASSLLAVKNKYHLPDKFIMYLGDINWNKNIPSIVKAAKPLGYPVVLVGKAATSLVPNHPWTQDILWVQNEAKKNKDLILTGFGLEEELPAFFNLATIYCQASFAEGFGLALVQAMQSGTPVAYSRESCLNEIMDYNGQMFDPYSIDSLKQAFIKIWEDKKLHQKYSQAGIIRAKQFKWEYTAIETINAYKMALLDEK